MRFGFLLMLGGAGLAGWHFGRRDAALRPYVPAPGFPPLPADAAVPVSALASRAALALDESRELAVLSRRRLAEGDSEAALQLHSGAWWKVGAAAVLVTHTRDSGLAERVRTVAEELNADGRRFEELVARGRAAGGGT